VAGVLIPSIYERERFCRQEAGFKRCPTFRAYSARRAQLSQDIYYSLWLPTVEPASDRSEAGDLAASPPAV
jgi:hypothetical protein